MRSLACLATFVAASPARAGSVPGEVRLVSGAEVKALCGELGPSGVGSTSLQRHQRDEALEAVYVMTLASSAFTFEPYDAGRGRLPLEPRFRSSTGSYELVLHGLHADERAAAAAILDLALPASAREAASLARQRRAGELTLTVWFRLPPPMPGGALCAAVHSRDGEGIRLAIEPIAFELARRGRVIGGGEAPSFAELREAALPVDQPRVVVSRPVLTRSRGQAPEAVARTAMALEPELLACYLAGLRGEPALRGTLVVGVAVDGAGHVTEARPELDGLGAPRVTSCVVSRFRGTRFPGAAERFSMPVRFTSAE
jgi:hypothetical protein